MVEQITQSKLSLQPLRQEERRSRYLLFLLIPSELTSLRPLWLSFFHSHTPTLADRTDFPPACSGALSLVFYTHTHTRTQSHTVPPLTSSPHMLPPSPTLSSLLLSLRRLVQELHYIQPLMFIKQLLIDYS